eukprot:COSAG04_NODE_3262_length_2999_cov_3.605862_2_plen_179_part_00
MSEAKRLLEGRTQSRDIQEARAAVRIQARRRGQTARRQERAVKLRERRRKLQAKKAQEREKLSSTPPPRFPDGRAVKKAQLKPKPQPEPEPEPEPQPAFAPPPPPVAPPAAPPAPPPAAADGVPKIAAADVQRGALFHELKKTASNRAPAPALAPPGDDAKRPSVPPHRPCLPLFLHC